MCYAQEINRAVIAAARKKHICAWCGEVIEKKKPYNRWFGIIDGETCDTKTHPECEKASTEYANETNGCWYATGDHPRGKIDWNR